MLLIILKYGLLLSAIASIVIIGSQIYNARLWLDSYPPNIQKAVPERTKKENIQKIILGLPFLIALFLLPFIAAYLVQTSVLGGEKFYNLFLTAFGVSFIFNIYDLLILDWLIFSYITPKYQIIKGSEDLIKEYKNYYFHFQGFIKGTGFCIMLSLAISIFLWITR